jgi:cytidyltransferase-like protein
VTATQTPLLFSVHGRFQPFHNGHLNYVRAALDACDFLYVGITQVERNRMKFFDAAPHRSMADANPFSFFERKIMIEETLVSEGIPKARFSVIPFPIEREDVLNEYFPEGNVCFTTIHSEWNHVKIRMLQGLGYQVRVLDDPDRWPTKRDSATVIRKLIKAGDPSWKDLVPAKVAELLVQRYGARPAT